HEAGHALVAHVSPGTCPLRKVSIVPQDFDPRGGRVPPSTEDRLLLSKTELMGKIRTLLAGRAAEEIVFGEISTGAADDLEQSDRLIRAMLGAYGMSNRLLNRSLPKQGSSRLPGPSEEVTAYCAKTERILEQEHLQILESAYLEAKTLIQQHLAELEAIAKRLLEKERIGAKELNNLLGPRPNSNIAANKNRDNDIH
ncbi:MAG: cell division protein FtsH, partial [Methylococcales bacterium]